MRLFLTTAVALCIVTTGWTQENTNPAQRIVYPGEAQDEATTISDQKVCYEWATAGTTWDPEKAYATLEGQYSESMAQYEQSRGGAVRGAAGGALMGLAIGAIAGDAGTGAAIGAVAGGGGGAVRSRRGREAAEAGFEEAIAEFQDSFRLWDRHWVACMEGHSYGVE